MLDAFQLIRDYNEIRRDFYNEGYRLNKSQQQIDDEVSKYFYDEFYNKLYDKGIKSIRKGYQSRCEGIGDGDYYDFLKYSFKQLKEMRDSIVQQIQDEDLKSRLIDLVDKFPNELKQKNRFINTENIDKAFNEVFFKTENNSQIEVDIIPSKNSGKLVIEKKMYEGEIYPIKIGLSHTVQSFDNWSKRLHEQLTIKRNFINDCSLDDFKNIFTFKNEKVKQSKKLNWCETAMRFALLMQKLSMAGFIASQFWQQCASCFTITGGENNAANLKTYPARATREDNRVIDEIIELIVPQNNIVQKQ